MKRIFIALMLLITAALTVNAQNTVTGRITDAATGKPLSGASVSLGRNKGIIAGKDGQFTIGCEKSARISVSYVGYETWTQVVKCNEPINIALSPAGIPLEQVEISATSGLNRSILHQPASIAKITTPELKRGTGLFLDDAIQTNAPGVSMNRRSVGGGQQFNIRGYGNGSRGTRGISSNFDGQGYKVYLNGIPITDAEGITTMDDIDFASIGNVEIVKGPAGTLYGLAIAGAVNLSTITPEKGKTSIGQEVLVGSYGLQRYTTQFQMGKERSSILLNYGSQQTDGYTIHNKSKKHFVNFTGNFHPNEKQSINTYAGYSNSYDERFGELTVAQWNNNDYSGNPEYIKRDAHSNVITFRAGIGHTYNFSKNIANTTTVFGTGFTSNASSAGGWTDKNTITYGLRSTFNTRFSLNGGTTLSGITGVETQRQDATVIGFNMKQNPNDNNTTWTYGKSPYWVINANTSNLVSISKTTSLFTEWTLGLVHDISVTAGLGVSNMKIELNDRFNPALVTRPAHYERDYKALVSPHVAINKVINKQFSVFASYSKGYKAPVSSYFYITTPAVTTPATPATGRVNEALKPEIGNQLEVGTKAQLMNNRLTYELTFFNTVFFNKMTAVAVQSPANPNTTLYSYVVNGGKQNHKGVEALVRFTAVESATGFFQNIRPFANLAYSEFKYGDNFKIQKTVASDGTEDYSNKDVAGVPKIAANLGVDIAMKYGLYASVYYNYKDRVAIKSQNDLYASSYNLLNAKLGMRVGLGNRFDLDAYVGGTNLTNTRYYMMVFVNQIPDAYIPAPRNAQLFGGINLKYHL
jgi:iron complex outermembrane recepter protein